MDRLKGTEVDKYLAHKANIEAVESLADLLMCYEGELGERMTITCTDIDSKEVVTIDEYFFTPHTLKQYIGLINEFGRKLKEMSSSHALQIRKMPIK